MLQALKRRNVVIVYEDEPDQIAWLGRLDYFLNANCTWVDFEAQARILTDLRDYGCFADGGGASPYYELWLVEDWLLQPK